MMLGSVIKAPRQMVRESVAGSTAARRESRHLVSVKRNREGRGLRFSRVYTTVYLGVCSICILCVCVCVLAHTVRCICVVGAFACEWIKVMAARRAPTLTRTPNTNRVIVTGGVWGGGKVRKITQVIQPHQLLASE